MRLFGLRNFWQTYAKRPRSYEGPQLSYYRKMTGLWMTGAILEAVGPAALTTDETWGSPEGVLELQQRNGIIAVHPGGTADIQRVSMARRIGIGARRGAAGRSLGARDAPPGPPRCGPGMNPGPPRVPGEAEEIFMPVMYEKRDHIGVVTLSRRVAERVGP
jgi:hypothetical protein